MWSFDHAMSSTGVWEIETIALWSLCNVRQQPSEAEESMRPEHLLKISGAAHVVNVSKELTILHSLAFATPDHVHLKLYGSLVGKDQERMEPTQDANGYEDGHPYHEGHGDALSTPRSHNSPVGCGSRKLCMKLQSIFRASVSEQR